MNTKRTTLVRAVLLWAATATLAVPDARAAAISIWGGNGLGELGDGTMIDRPMPSPVPGLTSGVTAVGAGEYYSLAVQDGGVYAWGFNLDGALGVAGVDRSSTPIAVIGLGSGVTAVAAGKSHSMALQNGAVYAWGYNGNGALGDGTTNSSDTPVAVSAPLTSGVTAIAVGNQFSLAIKNGGVWAWGVGELANGSGKYPTPVAVTGLESGVTAIAAGLQSSLAVQNGGVYAWGTTGDSPIALTGLGSGVTAVAAGRYHSLAVRNGGVYAWGLNNYGQLGDGTTTDHSTPEQIDPADLHDIIAVAAGQNCSYALSNDGSLWDWGLNGFGNLGLGNFQDQYLTPQHLLPPSGFRFTSIDANVSGYSFAIATLAVVPEPSTFALAGMGVLSLLSCIRQRRSGSVHR
jgi:alpha-tubulin suppressor-like RCC1 family protein